VQGQPGSHIETIEFIIFGFREVFVALFHNDVASRASAASSARMLKLYAIVKRHIQNGFRLAMIGIRQLAGFKLDGLIEVCEGHLGHALILAVDSIIQEEIVIEPIALGSV